MCKLQIFIRFSNAYQVYISGYPGDSSKVLISNFYQLGNSVEATAELNGRTLISQTLSGGFIINLGTRIIPISFDKISWSNAIDDGSGDIDNVTAVYTKVY